MKEFSKKNNEERMKFVDYWAEYVRTHNDEEWSRQQNILINSCLRTTTMTRKQYLEMKEEN